MDIKEIIGKMTPEEKIALCSGSDAWHTKSMEPYAIPSIMMADGPHGLRKQLNASDMLGINESVPATCFPTAVLTACSWDESLLYEIGSAIGEEAIQNGVSVVLGPGANIKRNPLCGRNFEYFSEDPYLTGKMAASHIRGIQSQGAGACLKHFAANNQEHKRFSSESMVDERTLHEIYLTGFEIAVKEADPATVMCAYNRLNGKYCSDNSELLTEILREEWGFDGLVVTDWGALNDRREAFRAGCDLCMPGGSAFMEKEALQAVKDGMLSEEEINRSAERVLKLVEKGTPLKAGTSAEKGTFLKAKKRTSADVSDEEMMKRHDELSYRAAVESAVLLKNEEDFLPLRKERFMRGMEVHHGQEAGPEAGSEAGPGTELLYKGIVFLGHMAKELRYQGAGSSHINPWKLSNVCEAYKTMEDIEGGISEENAEGYIPMKYVEGCRKDGSTSEALLNEAVSAAGGAFAAVIFAGLTENYESEGFDRENMAMPEGHVKLIEAVAEVNPNTVVVLMCGSPVEVPWEAKVKSILYMGLPGQSGGRAIVDLLLGRANPCGKLAESWPIRYEDCVCSDFYGRAYVNKQTGKPVKNAHYREGLYVGYRYYESAGIPVKFPFGYGLSYTKFRYSNLLIQGNRVQCMVKNVGKRAGKEIVQLYISLQEHEKDSFYRPVRELKGFQKIYLKPGESRRISFTLDERSFAIWNHGWMIPNGKYKVEIGRNVHDIELELDVWKVANAGRQVEMDEAPEWYFTLKGKPSQEDFKQLLGRDTVEEVPKKGEYTMSSSIMEMKEDSNLMKFFYKMVEFVISGKFGWKKDYSNPTFRMMMNTAADASLNSMKQNVGMKSYIFEGMLEMANGHWGKGIRKMFGNKK